MNELVSIRRATAADYDAVSAVMIDVYVGDGYIPAGSDYAGVLAQTAERARAADIVVAEDEHGAIVGTITLAHPGSPYAPLAADDELEFRMLAVAKAGRGFGIGAALVHFVLDEAQRGGYRAVVMSTMSDMVDARRLYDRLGFVHAPERDWSPVPGVMLTVMARPVAAIRVPSR